MSSQYKKPTTIMEAYGNPRYQGKMIVAAGGELYGTKQETRALILYRRLARKYPKETPETTVIPKGYVS